MPVASLLRRLAVLCGLVSANAQYAGYEPGYEPGPQIFKVVPGSVDFDLKKPQPTNPVRELLFRFVDNALQYLFDPLSPRALLASAISGILLIAGLILLLTVLNGLLPAELGSGSGSASGRDIDTDNWDYLHSVWLEEMANVRVAEEDMPLDAAGDARSGDFDQMLT